MKRQSQDIPFYFTGKRIIVTGASGYLASNLVAALKDIDCSIARLSSKNTLSSISSRALVTDICGDISCAQTWYKVISDVDIIYHFAAQTSVYVAEEDPIADLKANVLPTLYMLEACREQGHCPVIVFAGTTTQAGIPEKLPVNEGFPDKPTTVYDMHKLAAEKYLKHYAGQNIVKATTLRLSNVYGPGPISSSPDRGVINMMIRKALAGEELTIYGKGDYLRDYVYVDDVIEAFLRVPINIERLNGGHFLIGSGKGYTISKVIHLIAEKARLITERHVQVKNISPPCPQSPIESRNFVADTDAFKTATGWQAQYDLPTGIDRTLEFCIDNTDDKRSSS